MKTLKILRLSVAILFLVQCTHTPPSATRTTATQSIEAAQIEAVRIETERQAALSRAAGMAMESQSAAAFKELDWLESLPGDSAKYFNMVTAQLDSMKLTDDEIQMYAPRISKYLGFLMFNNKKTLAEQQKILFSDDGVLRRLMQSSTEFIFCKDPNDFKCIEQVPRITPTATHRVEDPKLKLGETEVIEDSFQDKLEVFFNEQVFVPEYQYNPKKGVARQLEKLINDVKPGDENAIYMALYGIDDIQVKKNESGSATGSLAGMYSSLVTQFKKGVKILGVFDTESAHKNAPKKDLIFSYQKPKTQEEIDRWIFTPLKNPQTDKSGQITTGFTNMEFQYNVGTQNLVNTLNSKAKNYEEATARLEEPDKKIMHNKFFIFKDGKNFTLWTGTANIARTCIGTERNSNMSVVVRENNIAQTFLDEFNEMYDYASLEPNKTDSKFIGTENGKYPVGLFKQNKTPNTKRLFHFTGDNSFVRVYFSPTDDGEHRAILPMLYSASPGDKIIISMFGATGIEYVRALQLAAARGVEVQIVLDSPTACGINAWIGLKGQSSLLEDNPYQDHFSQDFHGHAFKEIKIFTNNKNSGEVWKQNHQKIGLLLRKQKNGQLLPAHLIFGSQNWSEGGNDESDENMMAISKPDGNMPIGKAFAKHFEWLIKAGDAIPVIKAGCEASTEAHKKAKKK